VTWKWKATIGPQLFSAVHVNALRAALEDKLKLDFQMYCVTDDPNGLDGDICAIPMPTLYAHTPRCRRRMQQFDRDFSSIFGSRMLSIDLDTVIVDDITAMMSRTEPIVCCRIEYANVYSGSLILMDTGALDGLWQRFHRDPAGYPKLAWPRGTGSDQAMLNHYLADQPPVASWGAADGIVTYFGAGYQAFEHWGVGPTRKQLPAGAKLVILGSADLHVLSDDSYPWVRDHYMPYERAAISNQVGARLAQAAQALEQRRAAR